MTDNIIHCSKINKQIFDNELIKHIKFHHKILENKNLTQDDRIGFLLRCYLDSDWEETLSKYKNGTK